MIFSVLYYLYLYLHEYLQYNIKLILLFSIIPAPPHASRLTTILLSLNLTNHYYSCFLLARFPNTPLISWGISSVLFEIAHINNPTYGWSPPNYLYICLAFIAGLGYMWVWKKTGKITVSALTHALVNATWVTLFLYE